MVSQSRLSRARPYKDVPFDIYLSLVDSIYSEPKTLLMGLLAVSTATLISAWQSSEFLLYLVSAGVVLVGGLRLWDMNNFARRRTTLTTIADVRHWELRYVIGATASVALLGMWCFIAFVKLNDPFASVFSMSITIAYLIGITGRNFGSHRLVTVQIMAASLPITLALLIVGDFYHIAFAVILSAFFVSMKSISDRLRMTLLNAVIANREISLLAGRFDTALNNMPHGLAMFDAERRVVVSNKRLNEVLGIADSSDHKGQTVQELLHDCVATGAILRSEAEPLAADIEARLASAAGKVMNLQRQDGRTLSLTFQAMKNGGSVVLVEDVTERKMAEARITHMARYDSLTGLPNRVFLREQMEKALASAGSRMCAVMFVDLDQFKQVNDTLGHPRGDMLLRAVADRLRRLVRSTDIVARFGGDEFVIVQAPIANADEAAALARRIVTSLSETYEIDGHQVVVGASVGIALSPFDATGPDHLLKIADMALYWAKADQRGTWRFFEAEMDVRAHARRSLELDLRHALANNAFQVFYQPLFDLKTSKISTCEALLRWPHPLRGMISPAEFIPVAEEMGLIVDLGEWVLREACRTCATWPNHVRVAVNLSASQFRRGNVVKSIKQVLNETGLEPGRLEIEITESVLFQDTRATRLILQQIRDLGVRISLDDFGTGYSSLSYLQSLPLNKVKIDRSFLEGLETGERALILLRGVAKLSHELGLSVTVEGIETADQLALVAAEESVSEAQGFLFSPALPSREVRQLLDRTIPQIIEQRVA
jgi:diguanylate cyclase (GGDEF)-like protein